VDVGEVPVRVNTNVAPRFRQRADGPWVNFNNTHSGILPGDLVHDFVCVHTVLF
jgi:hypothetical protein